MAFFEPPKSNPISSISRIRGESPTPKDRRERRAVAEAHKTVGDIAQFLSGYRPATFVGTDGHTYETESKRVKDGSVGRGAWSVSFTGNGINIAVPLCMFVVTSGSSPEITINGVEVDHVDATKNVINLSPAGLWNIFLEVTVNDASPQEMHTQSVRFVWFTDSLSAVNSIGKRYIPVISVNTSTQESSAPFLSGAFQTFRRGDREQANNMVVVPF